MPTNDLTLTIDIASIAAVHPPISGGDYGEEAKTCPYWCRFHRKLDGHDEGGGSDIGTEQGMDGGIFL